MLSATDLSRRAHNMVNDYLHGVICKIKYNELKKDISTYFIEYKKKYNESAEFSWLAKDLEQDRFFDYGYYVNPVDALNDIEEQFS